MWLQDPAQARLYIEIAIEFEPFGGFNFKLAVSQESRRTIFLEQLANRAARRCFPWKPGTIPASSLCVYGYLALFF